jgi:hypothetical protein
MVRRYSHIKPDAGRQKEVSPLDKMKTADLGGKTANTLSPKLVQQLSLRAKRRVA